MAVKGSISKLKLPSGLEAQPKTSSGGIPAGKGIIGGIPSIVNIHLKNKNDATEKELKTPPIPDALAPITGRIQDGITPYKTKEVVQEKISPVMGGPQAAGPQAKEKIIDISNCIILRNSEAGENNLITISDLNNREFHIDGLVVYSEQDEYFMKKILTWTIKIDGKEYPDYIKRAGLIGSPSTPSPVFIKELGRTLELNVIANDSIEYAEVYGRIIGGVK